MKHPTLLGALALLQQSNGMGSAASGHARALQQCRRMHSTKTRRRRRCLYSRKRAAAMATEAVVVVKVESWSDLVGTDSTELKELAQDMAAPVG